MPGTMVRQGLWTQLTKSGNLQLHLKQFFVPQLFLCVLQLFFFVPQSVLFVLTALHFVLQPLQFVLQLTLHLFLFFSIFSSISSNCLLLTYSWQCPQNSRLHPTSAIACSSHKNVCARDNNMPHPHIVIRLYRWQAGGLFFSL